MSDDKKIIQGKMNYCQSANSPVFEYIRERKTEGDLAASCRTKCVARVRKIPNKKLMELLARTKAPVQYHNYRYDYHDYMIKIINGCDFSMLFKAMEIYTSYGDNRFVRYLVSLIV